MNDNSRTATVLRIGEIVLLLQKVEKHLYYCLKATSDDASKSLKKLLSGDKATLGQLATEMKLNVELSESFKVTLTNFVEKRNMLIHNISFQDWFDLFTDSGRDTVDRYLFDLLDHAKECLRISMAYLFSTYSGDPNIFKDIDTKKFLEVVTAGSTVNLDLLSSDVLENEFVERVTKDYLPHVNRKA
jgi:hypothetical protein